MSTMKECRGNIWPKLLVEAAKLRLERKRLDARETELKGKIKKQMRENGIAVWVTLSGYKAVLEQRAGRPSWDQNKLALDLGVTKPELEGYKRRGDPVYALTVFEPE